MDQLNLDQKSLRSSPHFSANNANNESMMKISPANN